MNSEISFDILLLAGLIAYLLGAIPVAYLSGRAFGINVFEVGSRQAGATNVFREVSRTVGTAVMIVDATKGLVAIIVARIIGLEGAELLLPAGAAVAGHWNSPFTKFKGGDGVSTLTGVGLGIAPIVLLGPYVLVAVIALGLNSKFSHPSLWAAIAGYLLFIALSFMPNSNTDPHIVYGLTGIGIGIMLHSMYFHRRHRDYFSEIAQIEESPEQPLSQDGFS
ncbi:MAG: glycerol-3-phosphate acyltransferase [Chloroflexi bacterium]|nr:glycerol-3-phosphate acyltransferase [Chloroflexota bacterium]